MKKTKLCQAYKLISLFCLLTYAFNSFAEGKKVLLFFSSIGMGHERAAEKIRDAIVAKDPSAQVVLKDIRDFEPPIRGPIEEKLYWYIVKNHPSYFTQKYREAMDAGKQVKRLQDLEGFYNPVKLLHYLEEESPHTVIATHYGAAQSVSSLRADGHFKVKLPQTKVGWLHTDYMEGYFDRISKQVDHTFLPHKEIEELWHRKGVPPERTTTTGMPVDASLMSQEPVDKEAVLKDAGLKTDPDVKTITLASGGEGVGNFPLIVKSLAKRFHQEGKKLQIIAVTAKNVDHFKALQQLSSTLPEGISLKIEGFIPQDRLLNYIKASDLYITKAGGLSPTEGFAIGKPMIVLDVYGGHEADNAKFFEKHSMADVNRDQSKIGDEAFRLIYNPLHSVAMMQAQRAFRREINLDPIVEFALSDDNPPYHPDPQFGVEDGMDFITQGHQALQKLARAAPADMELLLSYSLRDGRLIYPNPFGHFALKLGSTVYTVNALGKPEKAEGLFYTTTLPEYLYATRPKAGVESGEAYFLDAFGESFGRDVLGLRISGLSPESMERMNREVLKLQSQFKSGTVCYDRDTYNCVDAIEQVLRAGGFDTTALQPRGKITTPLDSYDRYLKLFQADLRLRLDHVHYQQLSDSQAHSDETGKPYTASRFPVSHYQFREALWRLRNPQTVDARENMVTKRIAAYPGQVVHEPLDDRHVPLDTAHNISTDLGLERDFQKLLFMESAIQDKMRILQERGLTSAHLLEAFKKREAKEMPEDEFKALYRRFQVKNHKLQAYLDDWNMEVENFGVEFTTHTLKKYFQALRGHLNHQQIEQLKAQMRKLDDLKEAYLRLQNLYGESKDYQRVRTLRSFFEHAFTLSTNLSKYMNDDGESRRKTLTAPLRTAEELTYEHHWGNLFKKLKDKMQRFGRKGAYSLSMVPPMLRILKNLYFPPAPAPGSTPIAHDATLALKRAGKAMDVEVEIEGAPLVTSAPDSDTVTIHAPTHFSPITDNLIWAQMPITDYIPIAAGDQFAPRFLIDRADKADDLVMVGSGRTPAVAKLLSSLDKGTSRNVLAYPQGVVGSRHELTPIRLGFQDSLVDAVLKSGKKVSVQPIIYMMPATFMEKFSLNPPKDKKYKAIVSEAIPAELVKFMLENSEETEGPDLNIFIRASWLENLFKDSPHTMGGLNSAQFRDMLTTLLPNNPDLLQQLSHLEDVCLQQLSEREKLGLAPAHESFPALSFSESVLTSPNPLPHTMGEQASFIFARDAIHLQDSAPHLPPLPRVDADRCRSFRDSIARESLSSAVLEYELLRAFADESDPKRYQSALDRGAAAAM